MHAAVLHALGKPPRFEAFPDPTPGEGEVLINVSAASLKPVDKQMAAGTHYASPREFPVVCGMDGVGRLEDGSECSSAERGGRTARWPSALWFGEFNAFRSLKNWTMSLPRPLPIPVCRPGCLSSTVRSSPLAKPS
jgi:NADPH:quinone reductase-like Zn-dependent oxidoreductase